MKNYFLLLLVLVFAAFTACTKDTITDNGKLDPNATISLRPAPGTVLFPSKNKSGIIGTQHLTALEIVKETVNLKLKNYAIFGDQPAGRGFAPAQRDTVTPKLMMYGTDIIAQDGSYDPSFIGATDVVLERLFYVSNITHDTVLYDPIKDSPMKGEFDKVIIDTIAYIPNSVLLNASALVKAAYDSLNYTRCYELFNNVFTFTPITGKEWRALKAAGKK